jgi:hypothetical protein
MVVIKGSGIIGFFAGIIVDVIVNRLVDQYWLEPTEAETYDKRKELLDNMLSKIEAAVNKKFEEEQKSLKEKIKEESKNINYNEIRDLKKVEQNLEKIEQ